MMPSQPQQQPQLTQAQQGLQYLAQLVNEYLKTMPPPVEGPVKNAVNPAIQAIATELQQFGEVRQQLMELKAKIEEQKQAEGTAGDPDATVAKIQPKQPPKQVSKKAPRGK